MFPFRQDRPASIRARDKEPSFLGPGLSESADEAHAWLEDAGEMLTNVVTNRPALALGAALAAGVFLGWLIKRR
jgi:hypothetical protein